MHLLLVGQWSHYPSFADPLANTRGGRTTPASRWMGKGGSPEGVLLTNLFLDDTWCAHLFLDFYNWPSSFRLFLAKFVYIIRTIALFYTDIIAIFSFPPNYWPFSAIHSDRTARSLRNIPSTRFIVACCIINALFVKEVNRMMSNSDWQDIVMRPTPYMRDYLCPRL